MIEITHKRLSNGIRTKWTPFNKKVSDEKALEILKTTEQVHNQVSHIDFITIEDGISKVYDNKSTFNMPEHTYSPPVYDKVTDLIRFSK